MPSESVHLRRGKQAGSPLNAAIVGGGKACHDLLQLLDKDRLSRLSMKILGVSDINPEAAGLRYAKELNLLATTKMEDLFHIESLNLIIELTGSTRVRDEIYKNRPSGVSVIDHKATRLIWDLIQMEMEKTELERERQRYQEETRKQTQVILDSLPYRVMVIDMDKTVQRVNRTFLKKNALTYEDVLGRPCYEVRYGLDRPCEEYGRVCVLANQLEEMKEKGVISTDLEYQDRNGETRFDVITIAPIYDEKGEIVQILEASRDVTERIRFQREAQKTGTFLEKVIKSTVDGIVVVDTRGNVLIFNEGMEQLTGYSAGEIIERGHLSSFYDIDVARENMRKMRSDEYGSPGKLNPTTMTVTSKEGKEIPVTLSASIIRIDEKEIGSVGVFTDMRGVLKMRKELEDANIQLIQSQKISSIGRMAAGVAHEINNPLSAILLYTELLKENLEESPQGLEDLREIKDQTLRCKKIVSDLLEFSRKSAGKASSFSLEDLLDKCLGLLVHKAQFQNIEVVKEFERDIPNMVADSVQLQQVFTNLFLNAADAMDGKGRLGIKAKYDRDRSMFIIRITDTGPGIPEHLRDKVFDIFFTTKPVGKGTGLGTSISQNIVKVHGGNISFECPPEGGTVFIVEIPMEHAGTSPEDPAFIGEESTFIELDES
jgi:two-component system NtrC family sensor kinase